MHQHAKSDLGCPHCAAAANKLLDVLLIIQLIAGKGMQASYDTMKALHAGVGQSFAIALSSAASIQVAPANRYTNHELSGSSPSGFKRYAVIAQQRTAAYAGGYMHSC